MKTKASQKQKTNKRLLNWNETVRNNMLDASTAQKIKQL